MNQQAATQSPAGGKPARRTWRERVARRYELIRAPRPPGARKPPLRWLIGELGELAEPLRRIGKPPLDIPQARER